MIRTVPAKLALVLAWTIAVAAGWLVPVLPARAVGPELKVELTSLRTTGSGKKTAVVLRGTVTNVGAQPAFGVRAVLWRNREPIVEPATFGSVLTGQNEPWGTRLYSRPEHYFAITESDQAFDPGASAEFTVRGTLAELGFTGAGQIYLLGVQVRGTADASSNYQVLTQTRTFYVNAPEKKLPLTSIVLLSADPSKVRPDVFADERLSAELSGRLDTLLGIAARPGMSWLVDPALIDEVADMADGYSVIDGTGTKPGTGQQVAQTWLQRFRALPDDRGARTLFAGPDVLGAEQNKTPQVLERSVEAAATVPELAGLPLIVLPQGGVAGPGTPAWLRAADADAIAVSTAGRGPVLAKGPAGSTLLRLAPAATAGGPGTEDGPVQRVQRQYAEAILGGGLARLISTPEDADADADAAPRWLSRTSLRSLLGGDPDGAAATLTLPVKPATLPASRFRQFATLTADFARYRELVPNSALAQSEAATLSRLVCSGWIGDRAASSWTAAVTGLVGGAAIADKVVLSASPRVLMSSRSNEFPVTVTNGLTEPIVVRVEFTSDNPQRIGIPDSPTITVGPGQSQTVNVRPEATSNGLVNVTASLHTASGKPVGHGTRIAVEVTDLGVIGWIIVIVSGVVLVAATALRIRQVRRKQREEEL
ncbi:MAG: DUF6049 family protein [Micropruina sp.]|uniref:DUF6049 family protein n=1 Tax=Micropruina sp. TaxID=2737536 RepID=UPI0039E58E71